MGRQPQPGGVDAKHPRPTLSAVPAWVRALSRNQIHAPVGRRRRIGVGCASIAGGGRVVVAIGVEVDLAIARSRSCLHPTRRPRAARRGRCRSIDRQPAMGCRSCSRRSRSRPTATARSTPVTPTSESPSAAALSSRCRRRRTTRTTTVLRADRHPDAAVLQLQQRRLRTAIMLLREVGEVGTRSVCGDCCQVRPASSLWHVTIVNLPYSASQAGFPSRTDRSGSRCARS